VLIVFGGIIVDRRTQQMNLVTQVVAEGKGRKFAVVAAKKRLVLQKYQKLLSYIPT
jgi:ribosomal protein S17